MGGYLDRLNEQYDEIQQGLTAILDRAADGKRDVNDDEQKQIDRDKTRADELMSAIEHYSGLEKQAAKVAELRRSVPATPVVVRTGAPEPEAYDILREFPTVADYAITVHRAMVYKDPVAREKLERATAHQLTTDNPGIIPRPVLGPVINDMQAARPFLEAITRKALPAGKFDRPLVTQHVEIAKQAVEKDLTASQKMLISLLPVTAATYAGHLNISRQDIKWTSPGILQIVFDDFAKIYALRTCADACTAFLASVTQTSPIAAPATAAKINTALYTAVAQSITQTESVPDTMFVSPDVWGLLGQMTNPTTGNPSYPSINLTSTSGAPLGLSLVVDSHFPAQTAVVGPAKSLEWYEDIDGLMQIQEPDVLGQLVGYAGFGAFLNTLPGSFTKLTGVVFADEASARSGK